MLGLLPADQAAEVEQHARDYPEIQAEIAAISAAIERYATLHAVEPDPEIKQQVMVRIGSDEVRPAAPRRRPPWLWLLTVLLVAALAGIALLWSNLQQVRSDLADLQVSFDQLQQDCDTIRSQQAFAQTQLNLLRDDATRTVLLAGTTLSPESQVTIYWNPDRQATLMDVVNLPDPPANRQYQLWALVGGTPVDMGVITLDPAVDSLLQVPHVDGAGGFAITLEPAGGSVNPTLDQMYVIGTI